MIERMTEKNAFFEHFKTLGPTVQYNDTKEYRQCLRRVFRMDLNKRTGYSDLSFSQMDEDLDEESNDELLFDDKAISFGLDWLYELTNDKQDFKELYDQYAGRMFSTDRLIGQAVLCCYDNFPMYYAKVWAKVKS